MLEEIIIDDICKCQNYNFKTKKCRIPYWINNIKCTGLNCYDIDNCYFKQFKRAEQKR